MIKIITYVILAWQYFSFYLQKGKGRQNELQLLIQAD